MISSYGGAYSAPRFSVMGAKLDKNRQAQYNII